MTTDRDATPAAPEPRTGYSFALTVALVYAAFGALWILLSDTLLGWVLEDRELMMLVSTIKGWVFVLLSALMIFGVAVRFHRHERPAVEHRSWRVRTPWVSMGVISLAIVGVSLVSVVQTWRQESAQMERLMRTTGVGMTERLLDWHKERLSTAHQVQHRAWVSDQWIQYMRSPSPGQLERVTEALEIYLSSPDVTGVELYDAALERLWLSGPSAGHHEPVAYQQGLLRVRSSGEAGWVGPWRDEGGQTHLAYVGFLAPGTDVQALVVMHVNVTDYLADVLDEWRTLESSGEAYWVSGTSDAPTELTAWTGFPQRAERSASTALALASAALAGDLGTGVQTSVPGTRRVGMALPLADTGWWIVLESGTQALWANVLRRGGLFTLAGLLGIFSAFAVAYLVLQRRTIAQGERSLLRLQQSREELAQSESRYRLLAENARDTVWLLDVASQRLVYISPAVEHLVGYTPDELQRMSIEEMLMPQSLPVALQWLDEHVARFNAGDATAAEGVLELFQRHRDGSAVAIEVSMRLVADEHGRAHQIQGVTRDISERHRSQQQIRMLSQATEQSPVSVIITNASGLIEYVNPAFERMSGYPAAEVMGRNPRMLQSSRTPRETYRRMWEALAQGRPWQGELINKRKGGTHYLQSVTIAPLRNDKQEVTQYISVQMDITAQRAAEERLELLAWFDPLTGLPNRQRLLGDIGAALDQRMQRPGQVGLIIMNVDRFKVINDALGRATGDQVLQAVADRLRPLAHASDVLAHLNGDEFGLLLRDLDSDATLANAELMQRAEGIHQAMETPLALAHDVLAATMSVGVTLLGMSGDDTPVEALRRADTALHRAKEAGGHQTAFFDAGMGQLVTERFAIEQDLRRGIEAGELRLFLQPQMNVHGQMVGAEALVRWHHPHKGLISPALFVPVAETSGLIEPLGQWVLEQVCQTLAMLHRQGRRLTIAVNISPRQFHQFDFGARVLKMLEDAGAMPGDLMLEITEGVVMRDIDSVVRRMIDLTRHGIRFSIDDFGTGYSSLSYLKSLPIHELKIDRSFVHDAPRNTSDAALVEAILSVARHLKLRVVAEGVESADHAAFFQAHPTVLMQGYFFGRPEPAEDLINRWLSAH